MFKQKLVHCSTALALVAAPVLLTAPLSGWAQIEEIVVTARRREENLQEVPLAVTVFGREEILRKGINSVDQVALLSASLGYESAAHSEAQKLSIRGISPTRGRSNLAIMIDGIDVTTESIAQNGSGGMLQSRFLDIARIELVKGPQSALYGRSAFNGALQYVSMDPAEELEGDFLVESGEHDRYSFRGSISGPMGDRWGYRLNAAVWDEEGFYTNERTGDTVGGADGWGGAVTLKWEPTEQWGFKFRASYTDQDREPNATVFIDPNVATQAPGASCADQFDPIFDAMGAPVLDPDGNQLGAGHESVFDCINSGGFGSDGGLSSDLVAGTTTTIKDFIEANGNPLGKPLVAGPIVAGVNETPAYYAGSLQSADLKSQFRGTLPDQDSVGSVSIDPDPRTGKDFPGSNIKESRFSLKADYNAEKWSFTSWTGYMDGETASEIDWQQAGDLDVCGTWMDLSTATVVTNPATGAVTSYTPPVPFANQSSVDPAASCNLAYNNNAHEVTQFSQELRWASNFDGWQQATFGAQYWDESRTFLNGGGTIRSRSFDCVIDASVPGGAVATFPNGDPICGVYSVPITGQILTDVLDARPVVFDGALAEPNGQRDTEHFSAYFMLETDLDDLFGTSGEGNWTFRFEGRWNDESTLLTGPDSSSSGSTGAGVCGDGPIIGSLTSNPLNFNGPPSTPQFAAPHRCSGNFVQGWFSNSATHAAAGGPANVPFIGTTGFDTPLCAQVDLSGRTVQMDPTPLILNCNTGFDIPDLAAREAFQLACGQAIFAGTITADNLQPADASGNTLAGPSGQLCFEEFHTHKVEETWFTPKVALDWAPKDNLLFYLSWARGQKPAGYNTVPFGSSGFNPLGDVFEAEVMDVTEFGYKTSWFENTLTINGAFFFQDYTDKQVNTQQVIPDPINPGSFNTSPLTVNASGAEVPGAELDVFWAPAFEVVGGNMSLSLSYTWLDAEYTDFALPTTGGTDVYINNNCTAAPDHQPGVDGVLNTGDDFLVPQCIVDRSGNSLEDAPEQSAVISGRYDHRFFGGNSDWYFEFDTTYRDKAFLEDANAVQVDEWWNTNIRLGWRTERYEAVFFVNNVMDDTTFQTGFTTPALASSFIFVHTNDAAGLPAGTSGPAGNSVRSVGRNGPEFNSGAVVATMRPPRHWGIRFGMKFGGN